MNLIRQYQERTIVSLYVGMARKQGVYIQWMDQQLYGDNLASSECYTLLLFCSCLCTAILVCGCILFATAIPIHLLISMKSLKLFSTQWLKDTLMLLFMCLFKHKVNVRKLFNVSGTNGSESLCRDGSKTRWRLQWIIILAIIRR